MHRYRLPVLPVRNTIVFPYQIVPLVVGRERSLGAVEEVSHTDGKLLAVFAQKDPTVNDPGIDDLQALGVRATVRRIVKPDTGLQVEVRGLERVRLLDTVARDDYIEAIVESSPVRLVADFEALQRSLLERVAQLVSHGEQQITPEHIRSQIPDALQLAYLVASIAPLSMVQMKVLMGANTVQDALQAAIDGLTLRGKPEADPPLLALPMPRGSEPPHTDTASLRDKLERAALPPQVRKAALRELKRVELLPLASPDRRVAERWLNLMGDLPWPER